MASCEKIRKKKELNRKLREVQKEVRANGGFYGRKIDVAERIFQTRAKHGLALSQITM